MKLQSTLLGTLAITIGMNYYPLAFGQTGNSLNPDISLTLDGRYTHYNNDSGYELPGFMLGGEAGRETQGFSIGHNELSISSYIDDMFYGKLNTVIADHAGETEVELEEAFIEAPGIGHGFTVKGGRFFSDIGYLNNQHAHSWDFTDAPLIYRGLFGNQLIDDGIQISWLAPTDIFLKLGAEVTRGGRFPAGGATNKGRGAHTVFIKLGGDAGSDHAWQLGFSHWAADIEERTSASHSHGHASEEATETPAFSGDSKVSGVDFIWKWAPNGNSREQNFKIQAEYFTRDETGSIEMLGSSPAEASSYDGKQSGWYLQGVYQFQPRWRLAYRFDQLEADNRGDDMDVLTEAGLNDEDHTPERSTIMLDYSHSEYSRLRLQYAKDDSYEDTDNVISFQYIMTLGAHGAHRF